jgi:hypothetical protein
MEGLCPIAHRVVTVAAPALALGDRLPSLSPIAATVFAMARSYFQSSAREASGTRFCGKASE